MLGGWRQRHIARVGFGVALVCHEVAPHEAGEVDGEVATEQGLAGRDGEDGGEQLGVELGLEDDEGTVDAGAAQVWRILRQVHLVMEKCNVYQQCGESGSGWILIFILILIRNYLFWIRIKAKMERTKQK